MEEVEEEMEEEMEEDIMEEMEEEMEEEMQEEMEEEEMEEEMEEEEETSLTDKTVKHSSGTRDLLQGESQLLSCSVCRYCLQLRARQ